VEQPELFSAELRAASDRCGRSNDRVLIGVNERLAWVLSLIQQRRNCLMSIKGNVLAQYLGSGDPALKTTTRAWLDNMADDATVEARC